MVRIASKFLAALVLTSAVLPPAGASTGGPLDLFDVTGLAVDDKRDQLVVLGTDYIDDLAIFTDLDGNRSGSLAGLRGTDVEIVGDRAYVALEDDGEVAVIDLDARTEIDRWSTGASGCPVSLAATSGLLWVGQCGGGIDTLDLSDGSHQAGVVDTGSIWDLDVVADDNVLYAAEVGSRRIHRIDVGGATPRITASVDVDAGARLRQIAVNPAAGVVVAVAGDLDGVASFDATSLAKGPRYPIGGDGRGVVTVSTTDGNVVAVAGTDDQNAPVAVLFDLGNVSPRRSIALAGSAYIRGAAMSDDGSRLFAAVSYEDGASRVDVIRQPLRPNAIMTAQLDAPPVIDRVNTVSGQLHAPSGTPLGGRTIVVDEILATWDEDGIPRRWSTTTGSDGAFSVGVVPRSYETGAMWTTVALEVSFEGDDTWAGSGVLLDVSDAQVPTTNGVVPVDLGRDRQRVSLAISQLRFRDRTATRGIVARGDDFADSLAGAPLLRDGPLIHTVGGVLTTDGLTELQRALPAGATVYILGGEAAVSKDVVARLEGAGFTPIRLSGPSRVETSVAIAEEVLRLYPQGDISEVLVARAWGAPGNPTAAWADSVTAGGVAAQGALPVLVTMTEGLHPAVASFLRNHDVRIAHLIGGKAALSDAVDHDVSSITGTFSRRSGPDRAATAVDITRRWRSGGNHLLINTFVEDGWRAGLAAAGISADIGGPLLVVGQDHVPAATSEWLLGCGFNQPSGLWAIGTGMLIDQSVVTALDGTRPGSEADC